MGRPKIANPKTKYIGIVTTPQKYARFKALNLIGDEAIDVLLYHLENDNTKTKIQKIQIISRIKKINSEIDNLEFEKLKLETKLEEVNEKIGIDDDGVGKDVSKAVHTCLQRYEKVKEIYPITDFIDMNRDFIENQAYLVNLTVDELKELIFDNL